MRQLLVLAAAALGILCFNAAALADGVVASGDYTILCEEFAGSTYNTIYLTFSLEESFEAAEGGIWYGYSIGFEPATPAGFGEAASILGLYGGYRMIDNEHVCLAGVGSYIVYNYEQNMNGVGKVYGVQYDSIAIGLKGSLSIKPLMLSGIYVTGISSTALATDFDYDPTTGVLTIYRYKYNSGVKLSYLQAKGTLQIAGNLCVYGVFRLISAGIGEPTEAIGYGGGLEYRF
ncbi:MAG: hypothetical protein ACM3XS_00045 [Bacteroidota bacterium]